jgi:hypothetical protein
LAQRLSDLGLEVTEYQSCYVLPTRAYRFLPRSLVRLLHGIEKLWPQRLRVLSFWQVRLKKTELRPQACGAAGERIQSSPRGV